MDKYYAKFRTSNYIFDAHHVARFIITKNHVAHYIIKNFIQIILYNIIHLKIELPLVKIIKFEDCIYR